MSSTLLHPGAWIQDADCGLDGFVASLQRTTDLADYPHAHDVRSGVLVYSADALAIADRRTVQAELIRALTDGPGVVVFEGAFTDDVLDPASVAFTEIIAAQRAAGAAAGEHFGKPRTQARGGPGNQGDPAGQVGRGIG